jgi:hypothetical protein
MLVRPNRTVKGAELRKTDESHEFGLSHNLAFPVRFLAALQEALPEDQ